MNKINLFFVLVVLFPVLLMAEGSTSIDVSPLESFSAGGTEAEAESPEESIELSSGFPDIPIFTDDPFNDDECEEKVGYKVKLVTVNDETRCEYVKDDDDEPLSDLCEHKRLMFGGLSQLLGIIKAVNL